MIFRYDQLRAFFGACKMSREIFALGDYVGQPGLILRHDIDIELAPAVRMAEIEAEAGVRGSFFVLMTAETYNPLSPASRAYLRALAATGAEIGLHFDPTVYGDADDARLAKAAAIEGRALEDACGQAVTSVSLHNPSVHNRYPLFPGWRNAYDPEIFSPDRYLSDSRMIFRHDPLPFLQQASAPTAQLCLHPEHYSEAGDPYPAAQARCVERYVDRLDEIFSVNSSYVAAMGGGTMRDALKRRWARS